MGEEGRVLGSKPSYGSSEGRDLAAWLGGDSGLGDYRQVPAYSVPRVPSSPRPHWHLHTPSVRKEAEA